MKIKKNLDNISEESQNALKNFRQNQIKTNIKLHKIFLILIIIIDIGFLFFILFYKSKISTLKKLTNIHTSDIDKEDTNLGTQRISFYKKLVNIASIGSFGRIRFSFIFDKSEDFQNMKKIIYDYKKEIGDKVSTVENLETQFLYEGFTDSDDYISLIDKIDYFNDIAIIIYTKDGTKFGVYHNGEISPDNKYKFDSDCKDVFLFTLDNNKIYKFKGKKNSFHLNKKIFFSLGDDELVIYNEYFLNGGYIDFPLKSFDFSTINNNILTKKNGKFEIKNIEIYRFL